MRHLRCGQFVCAFAFLAVVGGACGGGAAKVMGHGNATDRVPQATTTTRPASSATFPVDGLPVGIHTEVWIDTSRGLPANGRAPSAPDRAIPTTVWYPAAGRSGTSPLPDAEPDHTRGPFPIVVFAHGFAVTPRTYAALLARWASAGYVVVAPAIPLLNGAAPGGPSHADYGGANVADVEFTLREALRQARTPGTLLDGVANPQAVAVAGHSDGEVLAYLLAFAPCCHDQQVRAAVLMAGNLDNARQVPAATGVAILHLMSDLDEYNPYSAAVAYDRAHLAPPRYLLTLRGAQHQPPYVDPADPHFGVVVASTIDFLDATLKARPDGIARLARDAAAGPTAALESSP